MRSGGNNGLGKSGREGGRYEIQRVRSQLLTDTYVKKPGIKAHLNWTRARLHLTLFYSIRTPEQNRHKFNNKGAAFAAASSFMFKNGGIIETENTVIALDGDSGRQDGVVSIVRDMTKQVQAERALKISEEHYRLLADNTLDMIWTMNMDYEFTYVNPAVVPMMGYTPEAFIGTTLEEHCHKKVYEKLLRVIERGIAEGIRDTGTPIETEVMRKDGSPLPVEILSKILFDSRNRAIGIQGTARDISERLAMEAQLRQSQKLEAIGTLASSVAHEINNPISGISGYAELIAEGAFERDEIIAYSSEIKSATERIRTIVQNLLGFARKEDSVEKTDRKDKRHRGRDALAGPDHHASRPD